MSLAGLVAQQIVHVVELILHGNLISLRSSCEFVVLCLCLLFFKPLLLGVMNASILFVRQSSLGRWKARALNEKMN